MNKIFEDSKIISSYLKSFIDVRLNKDSKNKTLNYINELAINCNNIYVLASF